MSATPEPKRMGLEEYYAYHPDDRRYELSAGWVLSEPHPGFDHGWVCSNVAWILSSFVRPRELGFVLVGEAGYLLARRPPTVRIPDVSFVSKERGLDLADSSAPFPGAPDLAVEVLSPANRPGEMHAKVADYLAAGCPLVWVVDYPRRTITVHRNLLFPEFLGEDDLLGGGDVLPGFSVAVREVFRKG